MFQRILPRILLMIGLPMGMALFLMALFAKDQLAVLYKWEETVPHLTLEIELSKCIHQLQQERGLAAGYVASENTDDFDQEHHIRNQFVETDVVIGRTYVYAKRYVLPESIRLLPSLRQRILSGQIKTNQVIDEYSIIIEHFIVVIQSILSDMAGPAINSYGINHIDITQAKNYAGVERALLYAAYQSREFLPEDANRLRLCIEQQGVYLEHLESFAKQKVRNRVSALQSSALQKAIKEHRVEALQQSFSLYRLDRLRALQNVMGYDGFIHHFKNYVLRKQPSDLMAAKKQYTLAIELLSQLRVLTVNPKAGVWLHEIETTIQQYHDNLARITQLHKEGKDSGDIDSIVRLDDSVARNAFMQLTKFFSHADFTQKPYEWWDLSTKRIDELHEIEHAIVTDLTKYSLEQQEQALNRLLLMTALTVAFFSLIAIIIWMLARSITLPLHKIVAYAIGISEGQDVSLPKNLNKENELGALSHALSVMAGTLQQKIQDQSLHLNSILQNSPALIQLHDRDGWPLVTNASFCRLLQVDQDAGTLWDQLPENIAEVFQSAGQRVIEDRDIIEMELIILNEPWLTTFFPVVDESNVVIGSGSISANMLETKMLNERLLHSEKLKSVGELAGGVAHDFNNQLTGMSGFAELIRKNTQEEKTRKWVESLLTGVDRSTALIAKLLAFARKGKHISSVVDVAQIVRETIEFVRHRTGDFDIHTNLSEGLCVKGDPSQLQNALLNIVLNACDAMGESGRLTCTTCAYTLSDDNVHDLAADDYALITINDTGCGIEEDKLTQVFEPFYTSKDSGTGMGLAAVHGTIVNHRGAIFVESSVGKGATFKVLLPICDKSVGGQHESRFSHFKVPAIDQEGSRSSTVLLVDDEELVSDLSKEVFESLGYTVLHADNGRKAVDLYRERYAEIDLVFMDMQMPDLCGDDALLSMQEIHPDVRCVITSGFSLNERIQEVLDAGALAFLQKPFKLKNLNELLQELENESEI